MCSFSAGASVRGSYGWYSFLVFLFCFFFVPRFDLPFTRSWFWFGLVWFGEADRTEQTQAGCSCATRPTLPRTGLSRAALSITHTTHNSHLEGDETTIRQTASPPILHRTVAGPTNCSGLAVPSPQKFSYNKEGLSLSVHSFSLHYGYGGSVHAPKCSYTKNRTQTNTNNNNSK